MALRPEVAAAGEEGAGKEPAGSEEIERDVFFFFCGEAMEKEVQERNSGLGKLSFPEEA